MSNAVVTLGSTISNFDVAPASYSLTISGPTPSTQAVPVSTTPVQVSLTGLLPGDYTISGTTVDATGAVGKFNGVPYPGVFSTFTISAPVQITGPLLSSITVTLQ